MAAHFVGGSGVAAPNGMRARMVAIIGLTGWSHAATVCATIGALAWIATSERDEMLPACTFYRATGLYCPTCGGLRAVHDLLHGLPLDALHNNALVTVGVPAVAFVVVRGALGIGAPSSEESPRRIRWTLVAIITVIAAFSILRNVPGFSFLTPT